MAERRGSGAQRDMRLSGSGGQGILLAATIIADAATALGKHVVQTQSYGPAARGGASRAEVIISDEEIDYPEVEAPGISLCLSQAAYDKYAAETRPGGLILYDSGLVRPNRDLAEREQRGLPFSEASAERLGKRVVANVVAVGALVVASGVLPREAVGAAVARRVPPVSLAVNLEAFDLGARLASQAQEA